MQAKELIGSLVHKEIYGDLEALPPIEYLTNDSRQVKKNSCFIAIKGTSYDGHLHLAEIQAAGAVLMIVEYLPPAWEEIPAVFVKVASTSRSQALLANYFYQEPSRQLKVIAVTGTNGKTTTSQLINQFLALAGHKTGVIGTLGHQVGDKHYPTVNTTPHAVRVQELFKEMVDNGCQDAVIEASSHALALGRLYFTDVDCAIYTNLSREHLDFHHSMENYAYTKSLLFAQLGQLYQPRPGKLAIINADDDYSSLMMAATSQEVLTYSLKDPQATAYGHSIVAERDSMRFKLDFQGQTYDLRLGILGDYNISNYLAAFLLMVCYYGYAVDQVVEWTAQLESVSGRMEPVDLGQDFQMLVDFAHTPDAIDRVVSQLKEQLQAGGRLIVVFGHSGGNRDSGARPEFGDILFAKSDYIIFTADNPRHEPVMKIVQEIIGQHKAAKYEIIEDRVEAIEAAVQLAGPNDIVLCAGKGGESYQVIGDDYIPYDEIAVIEAAIQKKV